METVEVAISSAITLIKLVIILYREARVIVNCPLLLSVSLRKL